ncbi:MAG: hypothetical protein ABW154_11130 [Dyella sp.]
MNTCLRAIATAALLLMLGHVAAAPAASAAATGHSYVDIDGYISSDADVNAWYGAVYQLNRNFDDICGDTFCEGDYSNIQALRFACAVDSGNGEVSQCVWGFAASEESVDPQTGRVLVNLPGWRCVAPLAPHTTVSQLLTALAGAEPLYAALPGTTRSLYDGLIDCL